MKTHTTIRTAAALLAAAPCGRPSASAEDIDIYGSLANAGPRPNIVIVFDNASRNNSNFSGTCPYSGITGISTLQDATRCAMAVAVNSIRNKPELLGKFNMGVLRYGEGSNQGGEWIIPTIPVGGTNVATQLPQMNETGIDDVHRRNHTARFRRRTTRRRAAVCRRRGRSSPAIRAPRPRSSAPAPPTPPSLVQSCQRSFIIFIGAATGNNGEPEVGNGDVGNRCGFGQRRSQFRAAGPDQYLGIGPNTGNDAAWGDEWARFLNGTDFNNNQFDRQNIVTYTIATGGTRPNYVQFLKSMANQGGGKAFVAADINAMMQALLQIFNEIQAVNSVFASSSLPVSAPTARARISTRSSSGCSVPTARPIRAGSATLSSTSSAWAAPRPTRPCSSPIRLARAR